MAEPLRSLDPAEAMQARLQAAADDAANEKVACPRIQAMLTACKMAAGDLEATHRVFAEQTDLDLTGYSRASGRDGLQWPHRDWWESQPTSQQVTGGILADGRRHIVYRGQPSDR
jgi:hypothetical protein